MIIISFPQFFKFQCEEGCFTFVNNAGAPNESFWWKAVRKMFGGCTEGVRKVFGGCTEGVRKVYGRRSEGVRKCSEGVRKVFGSIMN